MCFALKPCREPPKREHSVSCFMLIWGPIVESLALVIVPSCLSSAGTEGKANKVVFERSRGPYSLTGSFLNSFSRTERTSPKTCKNVL